MPRKTTANVLLTLTVDVDHTRQHHCICFGVIAGEGIRIIDGLVNPVHERIRQLRKLTKIRSGHHAEFSCRHSMPVTQLGSCAFFWSQIVLVCEWLKLQVSKPKSV